MVTFITDKSNTVTETPEKIDGAIKSSMMWLLFVFQ